MSVTIAVASFAAMFLLRYLFQLTKLDNFESHNRRFEGLKDYIELEKSKMTTQVRSYQDDNTTLEMTTI